MMMTSLSGCNEEPVPKIDVSPVAEQAIDDINLLLRQHPSGYSGSTSDGKSFTVTNNAEIQNPLLQMTTTLDYADDSKGWYTRTLPINMIGKMRVESGVHGLCGEGVRITIYCVRDENGKQKECGTFEDYLRTPPTANSEGRIKRTTQNKSVIGGEYLLCTGAEANQFVTLLQTLLGELRVPAPEIEDRTSD